MFLKLLVFVVLNVVFIENAGTEVVRCELDIGLKDDELPGPCQKENLSQEHRTAWEKENTSFDKLSKALDNIEDPNGELAGNEQGIPDKNWDIRFQIYNRTEEKRQECESNTDVMDYVACILEYRNIMLTIIEENKQEQY